MKFTKLGLLYMTHGIFSYWIQIFVLKISKRAQNLTQCSSTSGKFQGVQGYARVSIAVLGPQDKLKVHKPEDEPEESGIFCVVILQVMLPPFIPQTSYALKISIYKCEHLPKMDASMSRNAVGCDPFCKIKFGGFSNVTDTEKSLSPEFNTELMIPVYEPIFANFVNLSVYDEDAVC